MTHSCLPIQIGRCIILFFFFSTISLFPSNGVRRYIKSWIIEVVHEDSIIYVWWVIFVIRFSYFPFLGNVILSNGESEMKITRKKKQIKRCSISNVMTKQKEIKRDNQLNTYKSIDRTCTIHDRKKRKKFTFSFVCQKSKKQKKNFFSMIFAGIFSKFVSMSIVLSRFELTSYRQNFKPIIAPQKKLKIIELKEKKMSTLVFSPILCSILFSFPIHEK